MIKILYLEDDIIIRENIMAYLEEEGYKIFPCSNGVEALLLWQENPDIQIMIADIHLPGNFNGLEVISHIRKSTPLLPRIVVTSAFSDDFYLFKGLSLGLSGYLTKPFSSEKLNAVLAQCKDEIDSVFSSRHTEKITCYITPEEVWIPDDSIYCIQDTQIHLTRLENRLLHMLWDKKGIVLTSDIMSSLFPRNPLDNTEKLRTLIRRLRHKIGQDRIRTIVTVGYVLVIDE